MRCISQLQFVGIRNKHGCAAGEWAGPYTTILQNMRLLIRRMLQDVITGHVGKHGG